MCNRLVGEPDPFLSDNDHPGDIKKNIVNSLRHMCVDHVDWRNRLSIASINRTDRKQTTHMYAFALRHICFASHLDVDMFVHEMSGILKCDFA